MACPTTIRLGRDGKTVRGGTNGKPPGVHLPAADAPHVAAVAAPLRVDRQTNAHTAAFKQLGVLPLEGKVFTGDAILAAALRRFAIRPPEAFRLCTTSPAPEN